jgi:acetylornithine deacetylase
MGRTPEPSADRQVETHAPAAFAFLDRLVQQASLLGAEHGAQAVLADELNRLGFDLEWISIDPGICNEPDAGVPTVSYEGRRVLVGRRGDWSSTGRYRSLLINGHLDVVPVGSSEQWSAEPFRPTYTPDGRLIGRGAGDMKAGFAMVTLALDALGVTCPQSHEWPLCVVGAIEEECTGNGTLASIRAQVIADGVLLPEPTALAISLSGIGVLWIDVVAKGSSRHAGESDGVNALDALGPIIRGLERLSAELNRDAQPAGADRRETYRVNVGLLRAGDWHSNVPGEARMGIRFGFPSNWTLEESENCIREQISAIAAADAWLCRHPPVVSLAGLRATGYTMSEQDEFVGTFAQAHRETHGASPVMTGFDSTTDARFYRNRLDLPTLCYGPTAHGIHAPDEAVELRSIVDGARTLTRAIPAWIQ